MRRFIHRALTALTFALFFVGIILAAGGCEAENGTAIVIGIVCTFASAVIANVCNDPTDEIYDED